MAVQYHPREEEPRYKTTDFSIQSVSLLVAEVQGDERLRPRRIKDDAKIREEPVPTRLNEPPHTLFLLYSSTYFNANACGKGMIPSVLEPLSMSK